MKRKTTKVLEESNHNFFRLNTIKVGEEVLQIFRENAIKVGEEILQIFRENAMRLGEEVLQIFREIAIKVADRNLSKNLQKPLNSIKAWHFRENARKK